MLALTMTNLHIHYELSNFTCPGPQQLNMSHMTLTTSICGVVFHLQHDMAYCVQNSKILVSAIPEIRRKTKNLKIGVFWGD